MALWYTAVCRHYFGQLFTPVSIDLAEYSIWFPEPMDVELVGVRPDGSRIRTIFTLDGVIDGKGPKPDFETFYFDKKFSGLVSLEFVNDGYALDNLVLRTIPEPGAGSLIAAGAAGLLVALRRRRKR